jgi:hypothetical protein
VRKVNKPTASFFFCSSDLSVCALLSGFFFAISFALLSCLIHAFLHRRHQQEVEGQTQSTTTSNTVVTSNTNTVNAGPYAPISTPYAGQRLPQPIRAPFMAQQQRPMRPSGPPRFPPGIPSYSSQIEGLSVSQAVVNDVLVDLQSKVINESLQQYQDESSSGNYMGKKMFRYQSYIKCKFFRTTPSNLYSSTTTNNYSSIRSQSTSC